MFDLWAIGIYDLRLTEEQFWRLTLKEFNLLLERHKEYLMRQEYQLGVICSIILNVNRTKGKVFKPQDFMSIKAKPKKQTWQEQLEVLKAVTYAFGGEVIVK